MSIGLLHGYLLEGSGSNLWTRAIVRALCRQGEDVHLVCQEPHAEDYDFVAEWVRYDDTGEPERVFSRDTGYPGRCVLHKPKLGPVLPVYVPDRYEEYERVAPMAELPDDVIEDYLERNVRVVDGIAARHGLSALHANHAVLSSVVAQRVAEGRSLPFTIMPHGSAIEYAVKPDPRMRDYATAAFRGAARIFVIGDEMRERVRDVFGERVPGLEERLVDLNLGVDTSLFRVVSHDRRAGEIRELEEALGSLERGRTAAQRRTLRDALSGLDDPGLDAFREAIRPDVEYDLKSPDDGLEELLDAVDWAAADVVLFVGRLIANKGPQAVLAAVPAVLERRPDARFFFVGHGPLREPLEAMAWAMEHGDGPLLRRIVGWGTRLEGEDGEGGKPAPFAGVAAYLDALERAGTLDAWLDGARERVRPDTVIFTGYLTHTELRHLFAVADAAVFPSRIKEAGPLVFLEAMASGCHPLGTDFGGMAASIDAVERALGSEAVAHMRLPADEAEVVAGIARSLPDALEVAPDLAADLGKLAADRYDWTSVASTFADTLRNLA